MSYFGRVKNYQGAPGGTYPNVPSDGGLNSTAIANALNTLCPVAVGEGTLPLLGDNDSVVLGPYAEASGIKAIAIGGDCISGGTGGGTVASGARSIAIGEGAGTGITATGDDAIAVGTGSYADAQSTALGASTIASLIGTAVGYNANAGAQDLLGRAVAVGVDSSAIANSVAVGDTAVAAGQNQVCIGMNSSVTVTSADGIAIGEHAVCNTASSIAIGSDATTNAIAGSIAIGNNASPLDTAHALAIAVNATSLNAGADTPANAYLGVTLNGVAYRILLVTP